MQYAVSIPPFGEYSDADYVAAIAREAEAAGWDGFFIWDHMILNSTLHPIGDTWVALAAIAMQTERVRIGPMLTPLPRRRPWKLARETVAIDRLSQGRLILGVGIGDPALYEFEYFGEKSDNKTRAEQLDEGLEILTRCWSGEMFSFDGTHYQLKEMKFTPRPIQTPRIPIWVGGYWPNKPPFRRAARWDGVFPGGRDGWLTHDDWRDLVAYTLKHRTSDESFDIVYSGETSGVHSDADREILTTASDVGATWWIESVTPWRFGWKSEDQWTSEATEAMNERIRQGPLRL